MGNLLPQHCNGAKYAYAYLQHHVATPSGTIIATEVVSNRFKLQLPSGYSLSVISPVDAMGNRDSDGVERFQIAPIIETALFLNNELVYVDEWEYNDIKRFSVAGLNELAQEYINMYKLIAPDEPDPTIRETPDKFYPPTKEGISEFIKSLV